MLLLTLCLAVIALLYACVGQAGASGYIAAMALFGLAPESLKPTALALNVLVSAIVTVRFARAGHFSAALFWPLAGAALPMALLGGYLTLPPAVFSRLLGALLVVAALPCWLRRPATAASITTPKRSTLALLGAGVGLVSGLTGIGGGLLVGPILIYARWATPHTAAAISAPFIFSNSLAALLGYLIASPMLPGHLAWFALAVMIGGAAGAQIGSRYLPPGVIQRLLGVLLLVAAARLLWG